MLGKTINQVLLEEFEIEFPRLIEANVVISISISESLRAMHFKLIISPISFSTFPSLSFPWFVDQ